MRRLLTRDQVLAAADLRTEDVPVPEWGDDAGVRIKVLTVAEHRQFTRRLPENADDAEISAQLMVACCVGEDGTPVFTPADVEALLAKSAAAVKRIGRAAMELNGLSARAQEDARKNSSPTRTSGSGSN